MCVQCISRELKDREKKWVCLCNISYGMQIKEKICLTIFLLETNHGCITTNPNQSVLQGNGGKRFAADEEAEAGVRKWLSQQSEEFYAACFDALVKR
jgi:hypothetical protein